MYRIKNNYTTPNPGKAKDQREQSQIRAEDKKMEATKQANKQTRKKRITKEGYKRKLIKYVTYPPPPLYSGYIYMFCEYVDILWSEPKSMW